MKQEKTINAPREYISYSQFDLFRRDPERYIQHYIYGKEGFENEAMRLGKKLAKRMETGEESDKDIERVMIFMPELPAKEYKIRVDFQGIPLFGILDQFNPGAKGKIVRDTKSGLKYTQAMADKLGQLTFYAMLVFAKYKKLPEKMFIDWARTRRNEQGRLEFTGEVITFETKRTMQDILLFYAKVNKAWSEIQAVTKKEYDKINGR